MGPQRYGAEHGVKANALGQERGAPSSKSCMATNESDQQVTAGSNPQSLHLSRQGVEPKRVWDWRVLSVWIAPCRKDDLPGKRRSGPQTAPMPGVPEEFHKRRGGGEGGRDQKKRSWRAQGGRTAQRS